MSESQELIRFGVLRIDAERSPRLRDGIGTIVQIVEEIRKSAVILGKIGHQLQGGSQFIISVVASLLLPKHRSQRQM